MNWWLLIAVWIILSLPLGVLVGRWLKFSGGSRAEPPQPSGSHHPLSDADRTGGRAAGTASPNLSGSDIPPPVGYVRNTSLPELSSKSSGSNAGNGVGVGVGEVTGPRSRHELSAWWLLVVVACLIAGAWLDGGMW